MGNYNKQDLKELAEKIESGEYFYEAREWYLKKYLYRFIERAYLILFIICTIVLFIMLLVYYNSIMPIRKSVPVKVYISSAAEESSRITYLGNKEKNFDINLVYIKFFVARFIEAIESYDYKNDFKKLKVNRNIIDTLGSEDIISYYQDKISIRNTNSLIQKYRRKVIRNVVVDENSIDIALSEDQTYSAIEDDESKKNKDVLRYNVTANFTASEIDKDGNVVKTNWQTKILLSFQTIKYNFQIREFSPFNFKVLSYESKKVN